MRSYIHVVFLFLCMNCGHAQHELSRFFKDLPEAYHKSIYIIPGKKPNNTYQHANLVRTEYGSYHFVSNHTHVGVEFVVNDEYSSLAFFRCSDDTFLVEGKLVAFINPFPKICKDAVFTQDNIAPPKMLIDTASHIATGYLPQVLFDGYVYLDVKGSFYRKCFQVDEDHYMCLDINTSPEKNYINCTYILDFKQSEISMEIIDQETGKMTLQKYKFSGELILRIEKE